MCSSCHGDSCTNVEETMIDDITDIGINDDTQDEEEDEETEEEEEEEEHATQIHTDARYTKKRKMPIR